MAIFKLKHSSLGKAPRKGKHYSPGCARAHGNYITRESTCSELISARCPDERQALKKWLHAEEMADRKNARIIDKVMVALPRELSHEEQVQLVRDYCDEMTKGRASWAAAIHDQGEDAHNPHAHIIFRDRDFETGDRVMFTSAAPREAAQLRDQGLVVIDTKALRAGWSQHCNLALELAGHDERVDHRKLEDLPGADLEQPGGRDPAGDRAGGEVASAIVHGLAHHALASPIIESFVQFVTDTAGPAAGAVAHSIGETLETAAQIHEGMEVVKAATKRGHGDDGERLRELHIPRPGPVHEPHAMPQAVAAAEQQRAQIVDDERAQREAALDAMMQDRGRERDGGREMDR